MDTASYASSQDKFDISCDHIPGKLVHVVLNRSRDSKRDKRGIQSTVVPVLAFCKKKSIIKINNTLIPVESLIIKTVITIISKQISLLQY